MYTYVGRGLGSFFGWMVAWAFAFAEPLIMPILLGGFGFYGAIFLSTYLGVEFAQAWIVLALVCAALVWFLNYRGIALSTRTGVALGPDRDRHLPGHLGRSSSSMPRRTP